jgi:serine/threonine protein kinase
MASPASTAEFIDLVRKSGVLDEKRLDAHLEKLRAAGLPNEPGKVAGFLVRDGLLTHFQAEQIMLGKWRRFTIGKYKVLERLGSGGMGSVYLCEHKLMRRRVAVKVLPTAKASDPSALERFYREARAVAALDHANIVHAYDIDQDENLHFLVMEYVDGSSLQEIIKKSGPMEPTRAAHYIQQAALGLQHAHVAGLVHRDIKPGNILVDRQGTVKVLDMGLARFFNDEEDILTKKYDENVLGTADYLAPEQALDSHGVDIRADIYSLGATFYFVLTGKTPFSEGTVAQKLIWHQTRQPKPIRSVRPDVPEGLVAVVDRMMSKDPGKRYQTPGAVAEALAPWVQGPIAPPAEAEMPRLSLAATGVAPGEATQVSSTPTGAPSPTPRKNWQIPPTTAGATTQGLAGAGKETASVPVSARVRAPAPPGPGSDLQPTLVAPRVSARPGLAPAPLPTPNEPDEESVPWERLTSDTDDPSARVDTAPRSSQNLPPSRPRPSGKSGVTMTRERRRLGLVIAVVSLIIIAGLGYLIWKVFWQHPKKPAGPPPPLRVNKDGQEGEFKTIKAALAALDRARAGDRRIIIAGGRYEERLVLRGKRGITIQAGEGEVAIIPPAGLSDQVPLLELYGCERVHIQRIKFNGQGRIQTLLSVAGECPGLVLERVRFEKFTRTAVQITNCAGEKDRKVQPVQLQQMQITSPDPKKPAPAITFGLAHVLSPNLNDHIHIVDCQLNGKPLRAKQIFFDKKFLGNDVLLNGKSLLDVP